MNILYLLKNTPDETGSNIIDEHKKSHEVTIININENKNYDEIVDAIASSDKVISW